MKAGSQGTQSLMNSHEIAYKRFSLTEMLESSTWRELKAVHYGLLTFCEDFFGQKLNWYTDNMAITKVTENGIDKENLRKQAIWIYNMISE